MNSLAEENYLKALLALSGAGDEVPVNDLARHLAIKMPTVTSMMKKLAAKRLETVKRIHGAFDRHLVEPTGGGDAFAEAA